ncbi:MAG: hypothetical protein A3D24_03030 [Candidatus Blackburnbacteria bacterium RIFCSPHIGHO2_02_FULL_39_13]|uniref:Uncharacterized protein n=1 Tax=Candidatus Blackburnbacteria bacterium RIFCSPLOWO2_01_FULL_40_20 TaxID=1797519 RepID=A0A1G1VBE2_9BACT|nr:MAG: hypothetical protein UT38_C0012G0011 [Microgenomates group bacterium GW2011_GWA2_39_19]OGY07456.1 MAG: hypothetical protein A2694_00340 [Candidatus Blackburnbacteria bacterium RIFCSPHIGHO2_01_FULL_40_17]OGY08456.1 MAG: hypothetical protein A3D24_03030 [Candidatus Blackburnbacteria bacterium RIFCSPHIGHO2_02_FULL_39_13]OGY12631.1 MAG: hypothetical protein A3A77_05125 [Candidatus Blackburnbacteria bacterium RIFCSPLOWO2_01_FULL_40_20]OGY14918.1 MAG: hypothetical protein A3I52_02595 [Candida
MDKKKGSFLTIFAIITTITIIMWISVSAYLNFKKVDLSSVPPNVLSPLNPNLDKEVFTLLEKKRLMSEEEISSFKPAFKSQKNGIKINESSKSAEATSSPTRE